MGAKKKVDPNADTPFEVIEKEFDTSISIQQLHSKIVTYDINRNTNRELARGHACICDLKARLLSKGEVKNISPDGARFEIPPINLTPQQDIYVDFSGSLNLGMVLCTIQWVSDIVGHKSKHKLVGLKFKKLSKIKKQHLIEYIEQLQRSRQKDPFV